MGATFPALTLWQPYASLPFFGAKPLETRTRAYPKKHHGKRIVIHAAAAYAPRGVITPALHDVCTRVFGDGYAYRLPRGKALGTIRLDGCLPVEEIRDTLDWEVLASGDFGDGRWAWLWSDPELFTEPVPCRGWQGWGRFAVTDDVSDLV